MSPTPLQLRRITLGSILLAGLMLLTACAGRASAVTTSSPKANTFLDGLKDGFVAIIAGLGHWLGADWAVYYNPRHAGGYDGGYALGIILFIMVLSILFGGYYRSRH